MHLIDLWQHLVNFDVKVRGGFSQSDVLAGNLQQVTFEFCQRLGYRYH